jgi:hypothetical protein
MILTTVVIRITPSLSEQQQVKLIRSEKILPDHYWIYKDLNQDGSSEMINLKYNSAANISLVIRSHDQKIINQFNLPGDLLTIGNIIDVFDINQDNIKDVFICTLKDDSLFLSVIDDIYLHPTAIRKIFLESVRKYNENTDYLFLTGEFCDLNEDGLREYIFGINGGHALQPRCIYAYDYANRSLKRSPLSGASIQGLNLFDLNNDGQHEIILNTNAPENFKSSFPFRDSATWIMVLDRNLEFYIPPISLSAAPSTVRSKPFILSGNRYLAVAQLEHGLNRIHSLAVFDSTLNRVKFKSIPVSRPVLIDFLLFPGYNNLYPLQLIMDDKIYSVDFELNFIDSIMLKSNFNPNTACCLDINMDGDDETLSVSGDKLNIFTSDFSQSWSIELETVSSSPRILYSMIEKEGSMQQLCLQVDNNIYYIEFISNPLSKFRIPIYLFIFSLLYAIFYVLAQIQNRIIKRKYERDRLISRLQLRLILNQLDPHFTYNALNAVGSLIYKEEKEIAYQYLQGLTDMLRIVSSESVDFTWELSNELKYVRKYLEIEKLRFREKFDYQIELLGEGYSSFKIPKMSILTFVENAIKHGLRNKEKDRQLKVKVYSQNGKLKIDIEDNGIGRKAAALLNTGSGGSGLKMMRKYFDFFKESTGNHASFQIIDLYDDHRKSTGTMVSITIG